MSIWRTGTAVAFGKGIVRHRDYISCYCRSRVRSWWFLTINYFNIVKGMNMSVARCSAYLSPGNKLDLLGEDEDLRNLGRTEIHEPLKATTVTKISDVSRRWRC
jgi:hypothetical protein